MGGEILGKIDPTLLLTLGGGLLRAAPTGDFAGGLGGALQDFSQQSLALRELQRRREKEEEDRKREDEQFRFNKAASLRSQLSNVRGEIDRKRAMVLGIQGGQEERRAQQEKTRSEAAARDAREARVREIMGDQFDPETGEPNTIEAFNALIAARSGKEIDLPKPEKTFEEKRREQDILNRDRLKAQQDFEDEDVSIFPPQVAAGMSDIQALMRQEIQQNNADAKVEIDALGERPRFTSEQPEYDNKVKAIQEKRDAKNAAAQQKATAVFFDMRETFDRLSDERATGDLPPEQRDTLQAAKDIIAESIQEARVTPESTPRELAVLRLQKELEISPREAEQLFDRLFRSIR